MKDISETIGKNILKYRRELGITQIEFAEKLNYSDKAISKWERGESLPDIETLIQISNFLA
jgi:transcriptional regulator with XRE-family HTH domain